MSLSRIIGWQVSTNSAQYSLDEMLSEMSLPGVACSVVAQCLSRDATQHPLVQPPILATKKGVTYFSEPFKRDSLFIITLQLIKDGICPVVYQYFFGAIFVSQLRGYPSLKIFGRFTFGKTIAVANRVEQRTPQQVHLTEEQKGHLFERGECYQRRSPHSAYLSVQIGYFDGLLICLFSKRHFCHVMRRQTGQCASSLVSSSPLTGADARHCVCVGGGTFNFSSEKQVTQCRTENSFHEN